MLPLWWPRTACIYCGARIGSVQQRRSGQARRGAVIPELLACRRHRALVARDPLLAP